MPKGAPTGGQFAACDRPESEVSLPADTAQVLDSEKVMRRILDNIKAIPAVWAGDMYRSTHKSVSSGEKTWDEAMDELVATNNDGRCERHKDSPAQSSPESYCNECHVAFMVEAQINPKPLPVPVGGAVGAQTNHHLKPTGTSETEYTSENSSHTKEGMTGDEKFQAAIRRMFGAPADADVAVITEEWSNWTEYTEEHENSIEVTCDGVSRKYDDMGALMRCLHNDQEDGPIAMALRFMRATEAKRPLLYGPAAVYLRTGPYSPPKPVFGKIHNVYSSGRHPQIDFMHPDGRREYLYINKIAAIRETDQSGIYHERDAGS